MSENKIEILRWIEDHLEMIDQRILPLDFQYNIFPIIAINSISLY